MKDKLIYLGLLLVAVCMFAAYSRGASLQAGEASSAAAAIKPFIGRWDLSIKTPKGELPSWIEVSDEQGKPKVVLVGVSDHATPLAQAAIFQGEIQFVSPKGEEGFENDTTFQGKLVGGQLVGTATSSGGVSWIWKGNRAPSLDRMVAKWGTPVTLFDGKDFKGWKFRDPAHSGSWKVEDGTLVNHGGGSDIITTAKFGDFKLHLEFECAPMSNSGVYLRGRYEVQVETDSIEEPPSHHMGGIYGFIAPTPELPRTPDAWQTYDITLLGRWVTVVQNGTTIIDNKEVPGITGGALDSHEELRGPIYLQGSEKGHVKYRSVVITPAKM